jgi:hypothetical protein
MFEYTEEGYRRAIKYLKDVGKSNLINKELSKDGYTVVALANSILECSFDGDVPESTRYK